MLHPALSRALATAHIEDLHRPATLRQTLRVEQGGPKPRESQAGVTIRVRQGGLKPRESQAGVRRK